MAAILDFKMPNKLIIYRGLSTKCSKYVLTLPVYIMMSENITLIISNILL